MFSDNISKRGFWKYVNKHIKRTIHHFHTFSVISILFEEMIKDLKQGKKIKIHNFGTLFLKKTNPRKYHDVNLKKVVMSSKSYRVMRFNVDKKISSKLCKHLDDDLTFKDDFNE